MSARRLLLCTDLDRTLIPNGPQPESPGAREAFARVAAREDVTLVYVTGRSAVLLEEALAQYDLPRPELAITDVGATILDWQGAWQPWRDWRELMDADWQGHDRDAVQALLPDLLGLRLQGLAGQGRHKLSFECDLTARPDAQLAELEGHLQRAGLAVRLTWSVDESSGKGLLDLLPARASKLHAVDFVRGKLGFAVDELLYAGDSGNDLPALTSALPAVLVANATDVVRSEALQLARASGHERCLYLARGGHAGRNGYYAAGILEGLAHHHPAFAADAEAPT